MSYLFHDILQSGYPEGTRVLELGLGRGTEFARIPLKNKVSVDIDGKNNPTFCGSTDEFFAQNKETFDVILIDADHSYRSIAKDFNNCIKCISEFGQIFFHDLLPPEEKNTVLDSSGDGYIVLNYFYSNHYSFQLCQEDFSLTSVFCRESIHLDLLDHFKADFNSFREKIITSRHLVTAEDLIKNSRTGARLFKF